MCKRFSGHSSFVCQNNHRWCVEIILLWRCPPDSLKEHYWPLGGCENPNPESRVLLSVLVVTCQWPIKTSGLVLAAWCLQQNQHFCMPPDPFPVQSLAPQGCRHQTTALCIQKDLIKRDILFTSDYSFIELITVETIHAWTGKQSKQKYLLYTPNNNLQPSFAKLSHNIIFFETKNSDKLKIILPMNLRQTIPDLILSHREKLWNWLQLEIKSQTSPWDIHWSEINSLYKQVQGG